MEHSRISFLIRSTCDVLPPPQNLNLWVGEDSSCPLCSSPTTLRHILTGCEVVLSQGRFTWCHDQVLRGLALALEDKWNMTNKLPPLPLKHYTQKTTFHAQESNHQEKVLKPKPIMQTRLGKKNIDSGSLNMKKSNRIMTDVQYDIQVVNPSALPF
ncbi:UNVERIFIED_CONTAM: hypothetical protein FKN15_042246 [Acipenser sinensis]